MATDEPDAVDLLRRISGQLGEILDRLPEPARKPEPARPGDSRVIVTGEVRGT